MPASDHREELAENFRRMTDEELIERWSSGNLTEVAFDVALAEFRRRQLQPPDITRSPADDADPGPEGEIKFTTVARSLEPMQIEMLRARLEAEGIPAYAIDSGVTQVNSLYAIAIGGVRLLVPRESAEEARRIIALVRSGNFALRDDESVE